MSLPTSLEDRVRGVSGSGGPVRRPGLFRTVAGAAALAFYSVFGVGCDSVVDPPVVDENVAPRASVVASPSLGKVGYVSRITGECLDVDGNLKVMEIGFVVEDDDGVGVSSLDVSDAVLVDVNRYDISGGSVERSVDRVVEEDQVAVVKCYDDKNLEDVARENLRTEEIVGEEKVVLPFFQIEDIEDDGRRQGVVGIFTLPDTTLVQRIESGVFGDVPESEISGLEGVDEILIGVYALPESFVRFERVRVGSDGRIDIPDVYRVLSYDGLAEIGITPEEFREEAIRITEGKIKRYEGPVNFYIMQTSLPEFGEDYNRGEFDEEIQEWISNKIPESDGVAKLFNNQIGQIVIGKDVDPNKPFTFNPDLYEWNINKNWVIGYADTSTSKAGWGGSSDKDNDGFLDYGTFSINEKIIEQRTTTEENFIAYLTWTLLHENSHASGFTHSHLNNNRSITFGTTVGNHLLKIPIFEQKIIDLRYDPTVIPNSLVEDYLQITEGF